jgi:hypothetical protein
VFTGLANFDWGACVRSLYRQYAVEQNLSQDELANLISPMLYAGALSCMMTCLMIVGTSNLATVLYHQKVMTRKEELATLKSGGDPAAARAAALTKKVRRQKEQGLEQTADIMQSMAVIELEENALVMELATGSPMELHYDLVAHDEEMAVIHRSIESHATGHMLEDSEEPQSPSMYTSSATDQATIHLLEGEDEVLAADGTAITRDELRPHRHGVGGAGLMQTGKTLVSLARQLEIDGGRTEAFVDARKDENQSLDSRVQGARELLMRTRANHMDVEWESMVIFSKRSACYALMTAETQ